MEETLATAVMWVFIALVIATPIFSVGAFIDVKRRRARGDERGLSSGALGGMDEVWNPSGYNARMLWDAQQIVPAPAPTPGDGPGVITGNRITLDQPGR
ncbi:hypothetical protein [Microbacterium terricola]|uniref:Uncharacterized protein n=1 Tax=Microbacterium terricola TaxID=344163 RepID=A0ABM8DY08_9MICO|nr:hypothetical protein [Microbacterium terricola]UYK38863.1 hypothetical protein OAU46_09090 [Microbacterium terricola]BDV30441.1 hypothetical protein Microterr_11010 [Microbacterium terricola]